MTSNDSHPVASTRETHEISGIGERVLGGIREAFCGLHGHDSLLQFEETRMYLKCMSCGHESPGWMLEKTDVGAAPRAARRTSASSRQLVSAHRAA